MAKSSKPVGVDYLWGTTRVSLGLIFFWAFIDKLFGLGFATCNTDGVVELGCDAAWFNGGSPTEGFLNYATSGPFAEFFQSLAGVVWIDWLFMMGLMLIGVALIMGVGVKIAGWSGAVLMLLMWAAALPPEHHPLLDDHIIYALVLIGLTKVNGTQALGFRDWWMKQQVVKDFPVLE